MSDNFSNSDDEFRVDIGRAEHGQTFVRVVHIPSGKERVLVGLGRETTQDVIKRFTQEIQRELGA